MKIVALVGSLRKDSYNMKLANFIKKRYENRFELAIPDLGALPHYNQDDEECPPPVIGAFKRQINEAAAVLIVTPEYNWSVSGVLKNALDWLSRGDKVLVNKPVLTAGCSGGPMGTVRAQLELRNILSSPGLSVRLYPPGGNEILVNFSEQKFDEDGKLTDPGTIQFIDSVLERFLKWI
jgi:NAD(P)H-dependent FMN reductase